MIKKTAKSLATLADAEREAVAQYRELGRRQLEVRLQQLAEQIGEVSPLRQRKRRTLTLRTELGLVKLTVDYGQEPATKTWFSPQQRAWGLSPHQKITPGLAEKLCFRAVATTSHAQAAAAAAQWGVAVDDAVIHRQVQRAGERAGHQAEVRRAAVTTRAAQVKPAVPPEALVIIDGRLDAAASRRGLGEALRVFVVADGSVWIWNLVGDRFSMARGVLDFYHASQHLWDLAHALHPENDTGARAWVEPLLHQLRHGGQAGVLQTLQDLPAWCASRAQARPRTWRAKPTAFWSIGIISKLGGAGGGRLSRRQWRDEIVVRTTPRPLQTRRPVLDRTGPLPSHGPRNRPPQPRLARSLAVKLRTVSSYSSSRLS